MTSHRKQRTGELNRRAQQLFAAMSQLSRGHLILANDQMAVIHAEWRLLCSELEEMLKFHPRLLDVLEWQFRKKHGAGPQDRYRTEELIAFACTHQLGLNGKLYREGWRRSQTRAHKASPGTRPDWSRTANQRLQHKCKRGAAQARQFVLAL